MPEQIDPALSLVRAHAQALLSDLLASGAVPTSETAVEAADGWAVL